MDFGDFIAGFLLVIVIAFVIAIIMGFPMMWLWNALMPSIFGLTKITFWQGVGLNLLSGLLFGKISYKENK